MNEIIEEIHNCRRPATFFGLSFFLLNLKFI